MFPPPPIIGHRRTDKCTVVTPSRWCRPTWSPWPPSQSRRGWCASTGQPIRAITTSACLAATPERTSAPQAISLSGNVGPTHQLHFLVSIFCLRRHEVCIFWHFACLLLISAPAPVVKGMGFYSGSFSHISPQQNAGAFGFFLFPYSA